jgi:hypothetical protein
VAGLAAALASTSFLNPATNPVSDAAAGFQAGVFQATAAAVVLFLVSEAAARRWSAPAGGWRWGWLVIGALFLILGTSLVLGATLEEASPLAERTRAFRLGIGGLWMALGLAGCALAVRARGARPEV